MSVQEYKGQFQSFNQLDFDSKMSKVPISHNSLAGFKGNSELSTNSETSEEFRQRCQFGAEYEQKMESPNFQINNYGQKDQISSKSSLMFPPNNFLSNNSKSGGDFNNSKFSSTSNRILGNLNNGGDTSSSKLFDIKKYEFKSKFDEYQQKGGQISSQSSSPQQSSFQFDRKGISCGFDDKNSAINNENIQPYNPVVKNQRSMTGDGSLSSLQQSNFEFGNKYRFNIHNDTTKNTIQSVSSQSGFTAFSKSIPNQLFDLGDESDKSYFKATGNFTPSKMNKNSGGLFSQGLNSSSNNGNFSNSFSHYNPLQNNSQTNNNLQDGSSSYGRKFSVDQFKRNNEFESSSNNRDFSYESKLSSNNLKKVQIPQQAVLSNGFKSLGESRMKTGIQMQMTGGMQSMQNSQAPLKPPKYPGSAHKQGNQAYIEGNPAEVHQQMVNNQKMSNIVKKNINIPTDILTYDQDYFPQYTMFLLAEEEKNISNFRERVEKEKQKIENDFGHMKQEINNLLDDLKIEMTLAVDEHFKQFIENYKVFKNEVIEFKSVKQELPSMQAPPLSQIDQKSSSNVQLIKELEELRYRNQMSKLYQYICEIQKANINRILQASQQLLSQMSSSQSLYNTDGSQQQLKELKNYFAQNLSERFDPLSNFIRSVQGPPSSAGLDISNLNNSVFIPPFIQQNSPSQQQNFQFSASQAFRNHPTPFSASQANFISTQQNTQNQQHIYLQDSPSRGINDQQIQFPPNSMIQMNQFIKGVRENTPERQIHQKVEKLNFAQQIGLIGTQEEEQYSQPFPLKQLQHQQQQQFSSEKNGIFKQQQQQQMSRQSSQQSLQQQQQQQQIQIPQYSQPYAIQNQIKE